MLDQEAFSSEYWVSSNMHALRTSCIHASYYSNKRSTCHPCIVGRD